MPKDLATSRAHCIEWIAHQTPLSSPYQSEDEMDADARNGEQDTIQGLLEMSAICEGGHGEEQQVEGDDEYRWGFEDFEL